MRCSYSQQPPPFHGYEEFELQISLLGSKALSSHFWINYRQGKANRAADTFCQYPQRSSEEEKTLQVENVKILHRLQYLLAKIFGFSITSSHLSPFHQVLIYGTHVLLQLNQCWDSFRSDIAQDSLYASIRSMNLRPPELQNNNEEVKVLRVGGLLKG